jgi:hypothetical protein
MRNINEVLLELEEITNYNLETLYKLVEIANTIAKDNPQEQEALTKSIACLWHYLKPVHRWVRDQNQAQTKFYDELDTYLLAREKVVLQSTPVADIKVLESPAPAKRKRASK